MGDQMEMREYRLLVFDRPVIRDWAFWHGMAWAVAIGWATALDPPADSNAPMWVDVLGIAAVSFFLLGWPVAAVRRVIRMLRGRLHGAAAMRNPTVEPRPPVQAPIADPPLERSATQPTPAQSAVPTPPVPLAGYTGSGLKDEGVLTAARQQLPYPVARAARALQTTQDPLEQYQFLLDLGEHLTLTLGMLSASWLRLHSPGDPALGVLHDAYTLRGVSQGHWHEVAKAAERAMAKDGNALEGFVDAVRERKGDPGLVSLLRVILTERNKAAHGARPHNRAEAAVRAQELSPTVLRAVGKARFLENAPWVLVEGIAFRRSDRRWSVRLRKAMGDHPEFDAVSEVLDQPLANDTFYVMTSAEPLDLTPMLVMRFCPECRQPEVCYADRVDPAAGVSLKSFARGHQVFDTELVDEVETLIHGGSPECSSGA